MGKQLLIVERTFNGVPQFLIGPIEAAPGEFPVRVWTLDETEDAATLRAILEADQASDRNAAVRALEFAGKPVALEEVAAQVGGLLYRVIAQSIRMDAPPVVPEGNGHA